jgi:hypothetical protein
VSADLEQRWKAVRAHIAKGDKAKDKAEQHYIAAGLHLKELKAAHDGTWAEWETLVKEKAGIGKSRASELMQIAGGTKTAAEVSAATTKRSQRHRALSPLRNGENADDELDESNESETERERAATAVAHRLIEHAREIAREIHEFTDDQWWPFVEALRREFRSNKTQGRCLASLDKAAAS